MLSKIEPRKLVKGLRLDMPNDWEKIIGENLKKYDIKKEDFSKIKRILEIKLNLNGGDEKIFDDYKSLFTILPSLFIPAFIMLKDYINISAGLLDKIVDYKNKESVERLKNFITEENKQIIYMFLKFIKLFVVISILLIIARCLYDIYKQKIKERMEVLLYFIENKMKENN